MYTVTQRMENFEVLVKEFCIRKLANDLYRNIETSCEDRALLDWLTAEAAVNKIHWTFYMPGIFMYAIEDDIDPKARSERRIVKIDPSMINYDNFARLCGKAVWDYLYQPCKGMLPKEYTRILWE